MKEIPLSKGKVAFVDDEDYGYLSQFKWYLLKGNSTYYATRRIRENGKSRAIRMHRDILKTPFYMLTDHKDGNGLNNQRNNIRICSAAQNLGNTRLRKDNTSGYKGVQWRPDRGKWRAIIKVDGKLLHIGSFTDKVEAAKAYDRAALRYFREFAKLNFPQSP